MTTFELINELSDLPVKERVLLIDGLLQSIHQPESTIDAVWLDEAEKRLHRHNSGQSQSQTAEGVFTELKDKFSK